MREIINVGNSLTRDQGATVEFEAVLADRTSEKFSCRWDVLTKIIVKLRNYAHMAAKARQGLASPDNLLSPFEVKDISQWGAAQTAGRKFVLLELAVTEGFPLQLAIPLEMMPKLISFAEQAALAAETVRNKSKSN